MNGYRIFIVFSIGYAVGTLGIMALIGDVSVISASIAFVLLAIAGVMYVMKKDQDDIDEQLLTAFRKGIAAAEQPLEKEKL